MFDLIILLALLCLGYLFGSHREKKHYQSILRREEKYREIMIFENKYLPEEASFTGGQLVQGNVVISVDYFKRFVVGLRKIFGGRLKAYESLLDRARREAVLRMKEDAMKIGANMIFNTRFETSSISKGEGGSLGSVEVYVFGSAVKR